MKKLLLSGIKRLRRTDLLMTVILTILALLASGIPSEACRCCTVGESSVSEGSMSASRDSENVQKSGQILENCPRCASRQSRCHQAGNCCKSLNHPCDCHHQPVAIFIIEDSLGSDAETNSDSTHVLFSIFDQLSGARHGDVWLASLATQGTSATVLLCRLQL
ncbi:hypothetical protein Mal48_12240 [Thalassoglobus polymorphus]|uniref:Uncharacterized protein n=1 Tax=Thalassoglobus polymorphus TaxID=2527994 RepID=A0A517QK48_9PLAN|nr:hypothetical protein Mal48_12240 [Thalassoglobus polymorphus]